MSRIIKQPRNILESFIFVRESILKLDLIYFLRREQRCYVYFYMFFSTGQVIWNTWAVPDAGRQMHKTVQIEIGLSENGGNPWRTKNCWNFFSGQKSIMPIVEIVFPQSVYLFHGTIPNNTWGGAKLLLQLPSAITKTRLNRR